MIGIQRDNRESIAVIGGRWQGSYSELLHILHRVRRISRYPSMRDVLISYSRFG